MMVSVAYRLERRQSYDWKRLIYLQLQEYNDN